MYLRSLGNPGIIADDGTELSLQNLPLAVLLYLAIGGPRDRRHLAEVFWCGNASALNSLSTTLSRIRARAPTAVEAVDASVVSCTLKTDIDSLRAASEARDGERVCQLYAGAFLNRLRLRNMSLEFEDWLLDTRASAASLAETATLHVSRGHFASGDIALAAEGAAWAWEVINRDGLVTPDFIPGYHRMLAAVGHPLTGAVSRAAAEFGVELDETSSAPMPERSADGVSGRSGVSSTSAGQHDRSSHLTSGQFFGFVDEIRSVRNALMDHRISTIVGLGGSGKTRLCHELVGSLQIGDGGDFTEMLWVNLGPVSDPGRVPAAIAAAAGKGASPGQDVSSVIARDTPVLLVLDNFEHVLEAGQLVSDLINVRPELRVLVSSRVPLGLPGEHLVPLTGLRIGAGDGDLAPAEELFLAAARRAGSALVETDTTPAPDTRAHIHRICTQVAGLPLALELAGSWTTVLRPEGIALALESSNDLLRPGASMAERSLEEILDQTWHSLGAEERLALLTLSVFPGGCPGEAVSVTDGLAFATLDSLVRAAVSFIDDTGRFRLHPLIARHAQFRLAEDQTLAHAVRMVQRQYVLNLIERCGPRLNGSGQHQAMLELRTERHNIAAAWDWCAAADRWDDIGVMLEPLRTSMVKSGQIAEAELLFTRALEHCRTTSAAPSLTHGRLAEAASWISLLSGRVRAASTMLDEADKAVAQAASEQAKAGPGGTGNAHAVGIAKANVLRTRGVLTLGKGEIDQALACFTEALEALPVPEVEPHLFAKLNEDLGHCHEARGEDKLAERCFRETLDRGRELDDPHMVARSYLTLAKAELNSDPKMALVLLEEGEVIARASELDQLLSYFPGDRARAYLKLGDAASASVAFDEGIKVVEKVGHLVTLAGNTIGRGECARRLGDFDAARHDIRSGVRLCVETNCWPYLLWAAVAACGLWFDTNQAADSAGNAGSLPLQLLELVAQHQAAEIMVGQQARSLLAERTEMSDPVDVSFDSSRLDVVAERVLALLSS